MTVRSGAFAAALVALALAVLAGCSSDFDDDRSDARRGGSLVVGVAKAPGSLDPAVARTAEARQALWLAFTPPMTQRRTGTEIAPGLADDAPESDEDDTRWTFRFRAGLRYSDGRALKASDFTRAIERALVLNPAARERLAGVAGAGQFVSAPVPALGIDGIQADDAKRTVTVTLDEPDPDFPQVLAELWAAPVPPGTPMTRAARGPLPGIGPYVLSRAPRGRVYNLTRRAGFDLPGVPAGNADAISARVIASAAARTRAALRGRIDASEGEPPSSSLPRLRSEYKDRYREFGTLVTRAIGFDLARRPFDTSAAREAVAFALDERTLARLEQGFLTPTCNLLPPAATGYRELDPCPFGAREGDSDLVRAEQLVRQAKVGRRTVLVDGGSGPASAALGRYGVETLDKLGVRARLARTPAQRRRAQLRFTSIGPADPAAPQAWFGRLDDVAISAQAMGLATGASAASAADRWADLDRAAVSRALVAPYGNRTTGVLLSERLDAANCLRFSPVYGTDLSSLCLR